MTLQLLRAHRNIPLLFAIRICRAFCINLIWTTWPLFVQSLGASVYEVSLVWALGGVASVLTAIPLSAFSDRFGRKPAMLLSLFFTIMPNFAYTFCTSWEQLIPLKMLANLNDNMYNPTEAAMIADISVPSNRGRLYGLVGVAHPIGSIVAPLVGGWILDNYGWNAVFYSIIFSATLAIVPTLYLTETVPISEQHAKAGSNQPYRGKRLDPRFLHPMLIFAVFNFFEAARMGLSQVTSIYLKERFNATSFQQGLFFSFGTMVPFLLIQFFGGWFADKYDRRKIIIASTLLWPVLMWPWPRMDSYKSLLFLQTTITLTRFMVPASQAYLMDFVDETKRGIANGIFNLGQQIGGSVVGPSLFGYVYEGYGRAAPFYVAALIPLPAIPILMLLKDEMKKTTHPD